MVTKKILTAVRMGGMPLMAAVLLAGCSFFLSTAFPRMLPLVTATFNVGVAVPEIAGLSSSAYTIVFDETANAAGTGYVYVLVARMTGTVFADLFMLDPENLAVRKQYTLADISTVGASPGEFLNADVNGDFITGNLGIPAGLGTLVARSSVSSTGYRALVGDGVTEYLFYAGSGGITVTGYDPSTATWSAGSSVTLTTSTLGSYDFLGASASGSGAYVRLVLRNQSDGSAAVITVPVSALSTGADLSTFGSTLHTLCAVGENAWPVGDVVVVRSPDDRGFRVFNADTGAELSDFSRANGDYRYRFPPSGGHWLSYDVKNLRLMRMRTWW